MSNDNQRVSDDPSESDSLSTPSNDRNASLSRGGLGLESSSVVPPPAVPPRDAMSLSLEPPKDPPSVPDDDKKRLEADVTKVKNDPGAVAVGGTVPSVQRLLSTTSTLPPPPPIGGLQRHNEAENLQPGAIRMAGLGSASVDTIQVGDTHPQPAPLLGPSSGDTQSSASPLRHLVNAFLVEDPPTAAVAPAAGSSEDPSHHAGYSTTTPDSLVKADAVSAEPVHHHRSFMDLLRDWRVLLLIFMFLMIIVGMAIGLGINKDTSPAQLLEEEAPDGPTVAPTPFIPAVAVTPSPTTSPTVSTTKFTNSPAAASTSPSSSSVAPTSSPPTPAPVMLSTDNPTQQPTIHPTQQPTRRPTKLPTKAPTAPPTIAPTRLPTSEPTRRPTKAPTYVPVREPTHEPTHEPGHEPTHEPTHESDEGNNPTQRPTDKPSSHDDDR